MYNICIDKFEGINTIYPLKWLIVITLTEGWVFLMGESAVAGADSPVDLTPKMSNTMSMSGLNPTVSKLCI
jgi:hypothetical protein